MLSRKVRIMTGTRSVGRPLSAAPDGKGAGRWARAKVRRPVEARAAALPWARALPAEPSTASGAPRIQVPDAADSGPNVAELHFRADENGTESCSCSGRWTGKAAPIAAAVLLASALAPNHSSAARHPAARAVPPPWMASNTIEPEDNVPVLSRQRTSTLAR